MKDVDLSERPRLIGIFGAPGCGKSFLAKDIIHHYKNIVDLIVVISGSAFNGFYDDFIEKEYIRDASDCEEVISNLLELCKMWKNEGKKYKVLLILDDVNEANYKSQVMKKLINNYRHYDISTIIIQQYAKNISINTRSNCALSYIATQRDQDVIDGLYTSFGFGTTKEEFRRLLSRATKEKYYFLQVDSLDNEDPFAKYIAKNHKFRFRTKIGAQANDQNNN